MKELHDRRLTLGLTQREVADLMGTSQSAVARAESSGHATDAFRERYARALDEAILSLERIQQLVQSHAHHQVWLFGSYASGTADARSDIDLIVEDDPQLASILTEHTGKHVDAITLEDYENKLRPWVKVHIAQHNLRLA